MILKIIDIKSAVLRKKAKRVGKIDKKTKKLIADMKETLLAQKDPEGVGLAAPQVGKSIQIFLMHYPEEGIDMKVVMNPVVQKFTKRSKKDKDMLEGCLSLPHYYGPVDRAEKIKLKYMNEDGEKVEESFSGFSAHIVQHEIDHLKGTLFIDHILSQSSRLFYIQDDEVEEIDF